MNNTKKAEIMFMTSRGQHDKANSCEDLAMIRYTKAPGSEVERRA
jgi:hypothetical protein